MTVPLGQEKMVWHWVPKKSKLVIHMSSPAPFPQLPGTSACCYVMEEDHQYTLFPIWNTILLTTTRQNMLRLLANSHTHFEEYNIYCAGQEVHWVSVSVMEKPRRILANPIKYMIIPLKPFMFVSLILLSHSSPKVTKSEFAVLGFKFYTYEGFWLQKYIK